MLRLWPLLLHHLSFSHQLKLWNHLLVVYFGAVSLNALLNSENNFNKYHGYLCYWLYQFPLIQVLAPFLTNAQPTLLLTVHFLPVSSVSRINLTVSCPMTWSLEPFGMSLSQYLFGMFDLAGFFSCAWKQILLYLLAWDLNLCNYSVFIYTHFYQDATLNIIFCSRVIIWLVTCYSSMNIL